MTDYVRQYEAPRFPFERRESEKFRDDFAASAAVTDGVVRWKSNGAVPPQDVLDFWLHLGMPFDYMGSTAVGKAELRTFLADCRGKDQAYTPEQLAEIRANFSVGDTVCRVVTGRLTKL